jgi:ubiquitin carboxyl-terminal hydrolase MINDY-1/2
MEIEFNLKSVRFFGRQCMILCQNQNGPCPLLAIANVLILQSVIHFNVDRQVVNLHALSEIVANAFVEKGLSQGTESESRKDSKQQQLDSALNMIPSMARGLDLNVCFSSVTSFEFTEEISVFDALDIPLLHGWVLDPQDTITYSVVQRNNSYNHLMFKLVEYRSLQERISSPRKFIESGSKTTNFSLDATSIPAHPTGSSEEESCVTVVDSLDSIRNIKVDNNSATAYSIFEGVSSAKNPDLKLLDTTLGADKMTSASSSSCGGGTRPTVSQDLSTEDQQLLREGRIIESFLASTASQLTHLGLEALHQHISDEQFAVFFRNNHFSTMFRYQGNLYLLVTDLGYQHETSVIWERLDGIDG